MPIYFAKTDEEFKSLMPALDDKRAGGQVSFLGKVRPFNNQKGVSFLHYEAHVELAYGLYADLEEEAKKSFLILESHAIHRLGQVEVGQPAVLITVSAIHRDEAFKAARFLIDELKLQLPIWKKEVFFDGTFTFLGCAACTKARQKPVKKALEALDITEDLLQKKVLLVGAGGLGCPLAINLSSLFSLTIYDGDVVEDSNLSRQFVYSPKDIGQKKARLLQNFISERTTAKISSQVRFLRKNEAREILGGFDLVIDGSDCPETKNMLKAESFFSKVPLISASVWRSMGDVQIYVPSVDGACLGCFSAPLAFADGACSDVGVLTHTCAAVAAFMAEKALAIVAGHFLGQCEMWIFDGVFKKIAITKDKHCLNCAAPKQRLVRFT